MLRHATIALLTLAPWLAAPALAGDPSAQYAKSDAKSAKGDEKACPCEACALAKVDASAFVERIASGKAPESFCDGVADAKKPCKSTKLVCTPGLGLAEVAQWRGADQAAILELISKRFTAATCDTERAHLLDFLVWTPREAQSKIVGALWTAAPKSFGPDHLLALADAGPEAMRKELRARAGSDVAAALWLALRGDDVGKATLAKAAKHVDSGCTGIRDAALGSLGLQALGDEKAMANFMAHARDAAISALDAGDVERARKIALETEFFAGCAKYGKKAQIAFLSEQAGGYVYVRAAEFASADQVFELIEGLKA